MGDRVMPIQGRVSELDLGNGFAKYKRAITCEAEIAGKEWRQSLILFATGNGCAVRWMNVEQQYGRSCR